MATAPTTTAPKNQTGILIATSLMLFSMFFGAGNLIFPPMLGVTSGTSFAPAIIGFLIGGVALPVLGMVAIVVSGQDVQDLAQRGGRFFGIAFPVVVYLSIGAFYALPRTGAVSFATAIAPVTGWEGLLPSMLFNVVFFGASWLLAVRPTTIVDTLGKFLTPALVVLLIVLILLSVTQLTGANTALLGEYKPTDAGTPNPLGIGLFNGYMTMDSLAALAFGIVVTSSLRGKGITEPARLFKGTITAGLIAGVLLAVVYVGLGLIGQVMPGGADYANGATLLSDAAFKTMGFPGRLVFGAIVLLACITTSVGLLAATAEFFAKIFPALNYTAWLTLFAVLSWGIASLGIETMIKLAVPVIIFIYPIAITVIFVTLLTPLLTPLVGKVDWGFKLAAWFVSLWSFIELLATVGLSDLKGVTSWAPLQAFSLGWFIPTAVMFLIGLAIDASRKNTPTAAPAH